MIEKRGALRPEVVRPCHLRVAARIAATNKALIEYGDILDAVLFGKIVGRRQAVATSSYDHDIIGFS